MTRRGTARAVIAGAVLWVTSVGAGSAGAVSLFDPALRFRALHSEHFVIYFHQQEDGLARRLAQIAEETWHALDRRLGVTPPRRTRVVLVDQTELFNGYATPVPYDTIVLYTVAPSGSGFNFDDWLRIGFTHEFTHIVHLDRSEGWARVVRSMFGRASYAFPNLFLPPWQVEGLATYEESVITGEGRLHAGDFRAIVDEAARTHRLEPLDRVNGGLTDWPGGAAVYAYGVAFHQYLADRFGAETLGALADATARRVPYVAAPAFTRVYGESLGDLWRDFQTRVTASASLDPPSDPGITRLTHDGFSVAGPRFDRFVCAGCPPEVIYSAANPEGFPAIYRVGLDGGQPHRVATRYLGSTAAIGRHTIYFDQIEQRRNTGFYSDLYALSRADGRVRKMTSEARLLDPDLSPDGETLACVQNRPGQRDLVLLRLTPNLAGITPSTLIAEPDTQFDAPKWSPDGRTLVVERHRLGAMPEIVTVDVASHAVRVVAARPQTRFVTPTWRPDGAAILAAAAPEEQTFDLFEFPTDGSAPRQLTHTTGGALWPEVAPDGRTLVFVGYTTGGSDVFSMPYPSVSPPPDQPSPAAGEAVMAATPARPTAPVDTVLGPYNPLETLTPTSWAPLLQTGSGQTRVGAGVNAFDVLGYHAFAATATWLVSSPSGAPRTGVAAPDWQAYYLYDRWRPTFYVDASSQTSFFAGPATTAGTPSALTRRERLVEGGVIVPMLHTRVQHTVQLSVVRAIDDDTLGNAVHSSSRTPFRAAWKTTTAHTYGYSISSEAGMAAGATAEFVRHGFGSSGDASTTTADIRAYGRGLAPHHVVAVRLGGGASTGDATVGRTFLLGGAWPGNDVVDFDSSAFALLRGFSPNSFAGSHVALANAEYRWPIARPQRGFGTWPLFLHTVHAAVFADAGHAWNGAFQASAVKTSAGAQISANIIAGFFAPFTVTTGAAWGHDGSGLIADRVTAYFRVGKGF